LAFSQEYMAMFNDDVANPFGLQHISRAVYPISTRPAICFGIDLAKKHDWTVIVGLDEHGQICHFDRFQRDWKQTTETIISLPPGKILIDSTGIGDAIFESIARVRDTQAFVFTSRSKQQLIEGLVAAVQKREVTILDGIMREEMESFEYEFTKYGVRYSAPSGMHDDTCVALALAKWIHASAKPQGEFGFI
jgi:hypothetical protein